ncbi:similar to Saccharomyces cerevisiae YGL234W ADE5,7 Bifunctional enzyme of the 'de novo' purine nucleotide biosynthetic pathway [Maudiozyma saulgeensis]|uniref:Similar to Saccharomyces cerevisiae YGL234W ADE5,7 Bifunctional enzyme of the 'de novo' purine nucleotide biosynthetic pathway n=1 Tax=Maudiozyma saulgeensis TaxID=1789683 RepID=A0A1X7QXA2_9SACH|nr:similar to Saccharomyces cerevisiae YGL234W ADE5,7 Bifunctional enzyme of the 'de novo' purine nucleotide biosynthetic pathway [Kazachstania saulgeensis]
MSFNILVLGNGGREHALLWKLSQSSTVNKIYVAPGNGGTKNIAKVENLTQDDLLPIPKNFTNLQTFAQKNNINLVIPGPEQPLVDGITTFFTKVGIPVFGPSAEAAQLEGSKVFAKEFMKKHNIPTATFERFDNYNDAVNYINNENEKNIVIKADGVAAGKGVLIPTNQQEALDALKTIMVDKQFGSAGDSVVIEEFLEGQEISILTISDGYSYYNLPAAQDHKRIGENDTGLNTGGMGAYAPAPVATPKILNEIDQNIIKPSIDGLRKDRLPFVGVLFTGIILTQAGPKVLEYNVRFGDPETQTVLPLLTEETDLAQVFLAAAEHRLDSIEINIKKDYFATTVVLAAGGYPEAYNKGDVITINEHKLPTDAYIFQAGTSISSDKNELLTAGGRVIAATAIAKTLKDAVAKAYEAVDCIDFKGKYFRKDIAHRAFDENTSKTSITYSDSGVSVDNGNLLVQKIKDMVKSTRRPGADSDIGGFGGVFDLKQAGYDTDETLLVAATDGVGTKLIIAQETNIHDTVGIDLVAMNVNDLVVQGAEPLLFLDYFATGALDIKVASDFVSGVVDGCLQAGCALVGGETSEMPGMYPPGHYDTNGTAVGAVNKNDILPKMDQMEAGNVLLGLASDGVHSNGYSLVRKVISHVGLSWSDPCPWDNTKTLGEGTLVPTKIYVKQLLPSLQKRLILGLAHITGGGLIENIPRAIPKNLQAQVDMSTWTVPEVFKWFGKAGNVPTEDILKTLNMGVGMVLIVKKENAEEVKRLVREANETVYEIGTLVEKPAGAPGCVVNNATNLY